MYLSAVAQRARRRVAQGSSLPAPVKGWNARDPLDGMDPGYAIRLDNFFPRYGSVDLRPGYASFATGISTTSATNVETLMTYYSGSTAKLLAAAGGDVFDATAGGTSATSLGSGFSNNRWNWVDFNNVLLMVNGADTPQTYNGTTLTNASFTGTGLTASSLIQVHAFKQRLYFVESNSASFWYGGLESVSGTLTEFPLAAVRPGAGNLIAMATMTIDGGQGVDDLIAFIMSTGTVLVYSGTDPGDATQWTLVGSFDIGQPIGRNCVLQTGPDCVIITRDGYIPLVPFLRQGRSGQQAYAISDVIQGAVNDATRMYASNYGWQPILYPRANMAIFNVPKVTNSTYEQHVQNTQTGAWCRFTGIPACSWAVFNDLCYFGSTDGTIYKFDSGLSNGGANIEGDAQTAFHYVGGRGMLKNFHLYRPILEVDGSIPASVGLGVDFDQNISVTATASTVSAGSAWGTATWDVDSWASGSQIQKDWYSAGTFGYSASVRLKVATATQECKWYATDFTFERGGYL